MQDNLKAKRQLAGLQAENAELKNNITICSVRIKELSQQLAAAHEDSECYRWLITRVGVSCNPRNDAVPFIWRLELCDGPIPDKLIDKTDEAIKETMKKLKKGP